MFCRQPETNADSNLNFHFAFRESHKGINKTYFMYFRLQEICQLFKISVVFFFYGENLTNLAIFSLKKPVFLQFHHLAVASAAVCLQSCDMSRGMDLNLGRGRSQGKEMAAVFQCSV